MGQALTVIALLGLPALAAAAGWPQWGRDSNRNMVSPEKGLPEIFVPGKLKPGTEIIDPATTRNVKWVAKLGSQSYGNPTISGGKVFIGTNNQAPRNPSHKGDRGIVMCLSAATGELVWQLVVPKLGTGKVSDWEYLGICSSPAVDGNRVYLVTNRCEVICLDTGGIADGNEGPFTSEAAYVSPDRKPMTLGPTDADIVWRYDMREELGVFPHNITACSVLLAGGRLFATTSNGQDWTHVNIPNPRAPALAVLDQKTGALLGEEASGISTRILHSNWSSPCHGDVGGSGRGRVYFGAGDGFLYCFDEEPEKKPEGAILKELWKVDLNPPEHRMKDGKPIKYPDPKGPSEAIATPVFHENRVYIAVGQDPEHGMGVGNLSCLDAGTGKAVWSHKIDRSLSTVAITGGLLFTADFTGWVYCFDAGTGTLHWKHDTKSNIWGSPLVADGKLYIGNEDGKLFVFRAGKEPRLLSTIEMGAPVYSTPVAADGVLYIATQTHLYAVTATAP